MVSIVIPAYNEEKLIGKCLSSLVKQDIGEKIEVILVNNSSTDGTILKARNYLTKLPLKIITEKKKGRGIARERGFRAARGRIILSTDADTVVPPTWVKQLVSELDKSQAAAVTGPCKILDCPPFTNLVFNFLQPASMVFYKMIVGHYWLSGFNFGIKKETYIKSGGFNTEINSMEDMDLSFKVKNLGFIVKNLGFIKYLPDSTVVFSGRRFKKGLLHGLYEYFNNYIKFFYLKDEHVVLPDVR